MFAPEHHRRVLRVPLTPLIDVVFILLLFFMLSSSFVRSQQIEFRAAGAAGEPADTPPRRLLLHADGSLSSDGRSFAADSGAFAGLIDAWAAQPQPLTVSAQRATPVQQLVAVLDRLRSAGIAPLRLTESVAP